MVDIEKVDVLQEIVKNSIPITKKSLNEYEITKIFNSNQKFKSLLDELMNEISTDKIISEEDYKCICELCKHSKLKGIIDVYIRLEDYVVDKEIEDDLEEFIEKSKNDTYISDSIRTYINEIIKIPLLSGEEEKELFIRYGKGDMDAKEKIIEANLRLVVNIAKGYIGRGVDLIDMIQDGNEGLMKAIERFDVSKNYRLSTYATWWIKQFIRRSIENNSNTIRIPSHLYQKIIKYRAIKDAYIKNHTGSEPSFDELLELTGFKEAELRHVIKYSFKEVSLNTPVGDSDHGEAEELIDFMIDNDDSKKVDLLGEKTVVSEDILKCIDLAFPVDTDNPINNKRNQRRKDIILYRTGLYGGPALTLEQVGKIFKVTRERIRQEESKALNELRKPRIVRKLRDYH